MKFDLYARWSYDQLRLKQPNVITEGLYEIGQQYFIVCPDLSEELLANDKNSLNHWFKRNKACTCQIKLIKEKPKNAIKVPDRSLEELIILASYPRTERDIYTDLTLELPKTFPYFNIKMEDNVLNIFIKRELSYEEEEIFKNAFDYLQIPIEYIIKVDENIQLEPFRMKGSQGDIDLISSKRLPNNISKNLKMLWEKDEDFWVDNRLKVLGSEAKTYDNFIPSSWGGKYSCCLVNASVFPPHDIRNYLSIYQKVILVAPLDLKSSEIYISLGVNESELVELVRLGRVQLLFPQSIDRYPIQLLNEVAEISPENIMFSRRLACITICDIRARLPFLYPIFGVNERQELLRFLKLISDELEDTKLKSILDSLIDELSQIWSSFEFLVHYRGAMGTMFVGFGTFLASIFKTISNMDLILEFSSASSSVEWGGALGANIFPIVDSNGYSEEPHTEIIASIYSGVPEGWVPNYVSNINTTVEGILSISKDIPVIEFAKSFGGGDIDRLRGLVYGIVKHQYNPDLLKEAIDKFNKEVISYEKSSKRLNEWDIIGLVLELSSLSLRNKTGVYIPLAGWFLNMFVKLIEIYGTNYTFLLKIFDNMKASIMNVTPDAVLVCRMKRSLK